VAVWKQAGRLEDDGARYTGAQIRRKDIVALSTSVFLPLFSRIACTLQDKDIRVVLQSEGDRCGHSGGIEHHSPVSERQIHNQHGGF